MTVSITSTPARLTHAIRFCVAVALPVTMCTFTSSRAPVSPTGAPMPSCSSTTKSCGSTWRISRPPGSDTARAASIARRTSSRVTSRFLPATATTPRLLKPLMCGPLTPRWTDADLDAGHQLRFLDRLLDRLHGGVEIDDDAALESLRLRHAEPDDVDATVVDQLADDGADLRGPDVEPYYVPFMSCHELPQAGRPALQPCSTAVKAALKAGPSVPPAARTGVRRIASPRSRSRRRVRATPAPNRCTPAAGPRSRCSPRRSIAVSPSRITTASCASVTSICDTRAARSGRACSAASSRAASRARFSSMAGAPSLGALARPSMTGRSRSP